MDLRTLSRTLPTEIQSSLDRVRASSSSSELEARCFMAAILCLNWAARTLESHGRLRAQELDLFRDIIMDARAQGRREIERRAARKRDSGDVR